ncbi:MAG: DNA polymerase, partial [Nitrospiraceae bacterium]
MDASSSVLPSLSRFVYNNCEGCPFKRPTCGSRGPKDSPFVIVGESPGETEIAEGRPFSGDSGDLLAQDLSAAFSRMKVKPVEPFITNALSCHPGGKKDIRTLAAGAQTCHSRLDAEIRAFPRKVVLSLGAPAAWSLLDAYGLKITQQRGMIYQSSYAQHGVVLAVHPAFLLRGGGSHSKFKNDLDLAVALLDGRRITRYIDSYHIEVTNEEEIWAIIIQLCRRAKRRQRPTYLACDLETSGFSRFDDDPLCTGFGWKFNQNYIIPEHLHGTEAYQHLMSLPTDIVRYVWHNGKFDHGFLLHDHEYQDAFKPETPPNYRVDEDTMLQSYVLDEVRGQHDLEQVSNDAVGAPNWKEMLHSYLPKKGSSYRVIPRPVLHKYCGKDIAATLQTHYVYRARVARDPRCELAYTKTLIPMSEDLVQIEDVGMCVDMKQVEANSIRIGNDVKNAAEKINQIARVRLGYNINPNSHVQVNGLYFDHLKIKPWKHKRSLAKDIVKKMPSHPALILLTEYRKVAKSYSTYIKPYMEGKGIHSDGRVHSSYLIHGTVTGRLASKEPNLQNIPRDPELRSQFIAPKGYRLVECDLNQAELRCLAHLSQCPDLMAIYLDPNHPGLHHETSVALFGPNYNDEDKMRAKTVNFGIVYGRTGQSIAEEYHLPASEGERWVKGWFERFPGAARFIEKCR